MEQSKFYFSWLEDTPYLWFGGKGGLGKLDCCFFSLFMTDLFSLTKMISVFQDKLAMELGYSMKYIFTEDQYEGSKDNPNEIPHDDLNLVIL